MDGREVFSRTYKKPPGIAIQERQSSMTGAATTRRRRRASSRRTDGRALRQQHNWGRGGRLSMAKSELTRPSDTTIKRLFARSGNRCAFPKCAVEIVQGDTLVGEICHIKAARPGGPRYDPNQSAAGRHGYDNLILLCGTHHTVIDDDEEAYTVDRLIKMKTDHEQSATPIPDDRTTSGTQLLIDQSVSAINQSGGIAARTVNIYAGQPSEPSAQPSTPQPVPFPGAQPMDGPARFRAPGDSIGIRDDPFFLGNRNSSISLATGPAVWLRLMPPLDPGKRWTSYDLKAVLGHGLALQPFLWGSVYGYGGLYRLRAEDGVGSCALLSPEARETWFGCVRLPDWRGVGNRYLPPSRRAVRPSYG
jgi:hypothetical protein